MKKILFILCLVISCVSCSDKTESLQLSQMGQNGKVEVELSVLVPEVHSMSRALGEQPSFSNLYLAVFDQAGYLLEYVKAEIVSGAQQNATTHTYKASLTPTSSATGIHFIANAPSSLNFGSETEVIGGLSTTDNEDAYWQRVYLQDGIKVVEGQLDSNVKSLLTGVRLIRNFAWIQLGIADEVTNFTLDSYCVVNTYDKGAVAPYNTSKSCFENYSVGSSHSGLVANGYDAFIPEDAQLNRNIPDEDLWIRPTSTTIPGCFIYERETPNANPLYILMKGTYAGVSERYYKIDLRDNDGKYFPVLRNFKYLVNVTGISHSGYDSSLEAAQGVGSGDISTSIETANYSSISNGMALIYVSYTDTTLVSSESKTLRYRFHSLINQNGTAGTILNDEVNVTLENLADDQKVIQSYEVGSGNDTDGWRTITIVPASLGDGVKTQTMTLVGTVTSDETTYTLQRKVKFTLRPALNLQLACEPDAIAEELGQPFDLVIKVPGGLGDAMFPLEFDIEAEAQSITPNLGDDLPVVTRKSIVTNKSKTTMGFIKSVSWSEYDATPNVGGYKAIRCHFKSNRAASATNIYVWNRYFNLASTSLGNYVASTFSNLMFNPSSTLDPGDNVTFSFTMSSILSQGYVYVTLRGLEPANDESNLVWDSEKNSYRYNPGSSSGSFKLTCDGSANPASVKLSAYRFVDAEKTINVQLNNFSNLKFSDPEYLTLGQTTNVTFTFNMSEVPSNDVFVTLTNLEPVGNSQLTLVDASTGKYKFNTRPTGNSASVTLRNTVAQVGTTGTVKLSSLYFNDATANISMRYIIPNNNIYTGRNNTTYYIFATDPGRQNNNNGNIGSFKTNNQGKNNAQFEILSTNISKLKDGYVYIRYSVTSGSGWQQTTTYYVAKVLLSDLMKEGGYVINSDEFKQK